MMNRLVWLLVLVLAASLAYTGLGLDRQLRIELAQIDPLRGEEQSLALPLREPIQLERGSSRHLRLSLSGQGFEHTGVLTLETLGGALEVIHQNASPYEIRHRCSAEPGFRSTCPLVIRVGKEATEIVIQARGNAPVVVTGIGYEAATAKRSTSTSGSMLIYGFMLLTAIGPLLVWVRRYPLLEGLLLPALGLAWIGWTSPSGLAVALMFVGVGYLGITAVARAPAGRRPLLLCVTGILLLVVLVKFVAPLIASAFANPGNFSLALPLGVSYFAIRIVDLLLAANAGTLADFRPRDYATFLLLPHTLPAGPILTYADFRRSAIAGYGVVDFSAGAARVGVGIAKKLLADAVLLPRVVHDMDLFLTGGWDAHPAGVLLMLGVNTAYVYLDFSAYCDMAIGAGRAGGRRIPENFDWPLLRSGIREFWRHWHVTLSQWVMRRVYLPAFLQTRSVPLAMTICMLVIGLWHALNVPWVLWAFHHASAMATEARLGARPPGWWMRISNPVRYFLGCLFIWAWVSLGHSFTMFASLEAATRSYLIAWSAPVRLLGGFY